MASHRDGRGEELPFIAGCSPASVCPTQVILTIKMLLLTPLHPPHFAGKLPRSPICLHLTYLQKQTGRTCPSWSTNPLQSSLIAPAIQIQSSSPEQPGTWQGCPLGQPCIARGLAGVSPGGDPRSRPGHPCHQRDPAVGPTPWHCPCPQPGDGTRPGPAPCPAVPCVSHTPPLFELPGDVCKQDGRPGCGNSLQPGAGGAIR